MIIYFYKLNNQQKKIKSNFQNIYYSKNIRKEGFKLNVNNFFFIQVYLKSKLWVKPIYLRIVSI